ncbi:MAG TPA: pyrimidine reductase family protein [Acidimicrobiales bacterium]|nr:pyrimidine reductase family protein [Acidimicrobiales bacterium]
MRQLLPDPVDDVDPEVVYADDDRPAPVGRPWVMANMVTSADGSAAVDGRSGPLGGPADRAVFHLLRSLADVILVAAGTVRAEHYRPARGPAPIAVVTRSLDLDLTSALFTEATARTIVVTCAAADPGRLAAVREVADVVVAGDERVDVAAALAALGERGHRLVLCEGGPTLLGQVASAGVLDELCLTISPILTAGDGPRLLDGPALTPPAALRLATLLEDDGTLFARYLS